MVFYFKCMRTVDNIISEIETRYNKWKRKYVAAILFLVVLYVASLADEEVFGPISCCHICFFVHFFVYLLVMASTKNDKCLCFRSTLRRLELPSSFENVSFVLPCSFSPKDADWLECETSSVIFFTLITVVRIVILNLNENYIGRQSFVKLLVRTHTSTSHPEEDNHVIVCVCRGRVRRTVTTVRKDWQQWVEWTTADRRVCDVF